MKTNLISRCLRFASVFSMASCIGAAGLLQMPAAHARHIDAAQVAEHERMLALVPTAQATHKAKATGGDWTNPGTWEGGTVPGNGARVWIPAAATVSFNGNSTTPIQWLFVEGVLRFSTNANTTLYVDTIVVNENGTWEQGNATNGTPIGAAFKSEIVFTDTGALSESIDPSLMGRGFIGHGKVRICGATVTPFLKTNSGLAGGATSAGLATTPTGWRTGDNVVVTAMKMTDANEPTDEFRTLTSTSGNGVGWSGGLVHPRPVEYAAFGVFPYVSNLSRNIVFRSANVADRSRRGHFMLMHNRDCDIRYAGFYDMGRTRKDIDVTSSATSSTPAGSNPRGRYALHFHRTGKDDKNVTPSYVQGCAVVNPASWSYVNHDSFVVFEDNVSHNAFGAGFITENGAELGTFRRNLASTTRGRGFIKDGTPTHDLARSGAGFWFQGSNLTVEDNVSTGAGQGFSYFQRSGVDLGDSQKVLASTLIDFDAAGGNPFVLSADTPMMRFKGNVAMGCYNGLFNVDNEINGIWPTNSVLEDYTDLNSRDKDAVRVEYYRNFTFKNMRILRDSTQPASIYHGLYALNANHRVDVLYPLETRGTDRLDGVYIRGFLNGVSNDDGGGAERIARHDIINNSLDFVGPGVAVKNTGSYNGVPLLRYLSSADILPFPTFTPIAGTYTTGQTVSITAPVGTTIYYVTGGTGYSVPSVEDRMVPGQWTQYTGPITINATKKLVAIAVKNGIYSRIRNGVFTIDAAAPPPPPPPVVGGTGSISRDVWTNIGGVLVTQIPVGTAPQSSDTLTSLEAPTNTADNYGTRIRGYITAPTTGNYTFWVAGDDNCELWLSTNDQPGSKTKIAEVASWTNSREWNKFPSQKSVTRSLTAGQRYYVEVLHKEGSGGDNVAVGWSKPGQGVSVPSEVVPGSVLSPFAGGTTPPPPPPPTNTTVTINPTDDRDTQSDNASGTNAGINASQWNTAYFRFASGVLPRTVTRAILRIHKPDASSNLTVIAAGVSGDAWTQATAVGSLPGLGGVIASIVAPNGGGYIEIDVTNAVRTEAAGDGVFSVAINTNSGSWTGLTSKEGANKPELVITY